MKKIFLLIAMTPFLLAMTCENEEEVICTLEAKAGLNVTVKDVVTNQILSEGVTVIAQEGDYTETLQLFVGDEPVVFVGAWERVGTYTITVTKEDYQTFTAAPLLVTADPCHVIPQEIVVNLQPN